MEDYRYEVPVRRVNEKVRIPKELVKRVKGLSPRLISRMRREVVDCPVLGSRVPFLQCFLCPNFVRRVRGVVHCKGREL